MSKYMMVPAVLVIMAVGLVPLFSMVNYSVQTPYATENVFVGLGNFQKVLSDQRFLNSLSRTVIFAFTVLCLELPLGLGFALLLYERGRLNTLISTIIIIPALIPSISIGLLWRLLIRGSGPIGQLAAVFFPEYDPFRTASHAYATILAMDVWHWTSLITIVLSAGLAGMDRTPVLSAKTEGATRWQIFRHIELPAIQFPLVFVSLLRLIDALKIYDEVLVLTAGGPGLTNEYVSLYIKTMSIEQWLVGFGAATSLIYLFIVLMLCYALLIVMTKGRGVI